MPHLAFARKYRPKDFDELVGQEHIAVTLKNAVQQNQLAHAYLFSGPRGIGKTSTARILAKALNCRQGPVPDPCDKCVSCREISESRSLDVLEIDGASNRGIDEIRALRENVKFAPSAGRFKIYIIDEVHMLTAEAFNALLKTLEEPPAHVVFIFATTEPHKVLPTILSRCQRFDFRKISAADIAQTLKKLAKREGVRIEENALFAVARSADGSLRDAEVILEQMSSFCRGNITEADVNTVLGLITREAVFLLAEKLNRGHLAENLLLVDALIKEGKEPGLILEALLEHFRNLMLVKCGCRRLVNAAEEDREHISRQSEKLSLEYILYCITVLTTVQERIKRQGTARVLLEMVLVKLSEPAPESLSGELSEQLARIEEQLKNFSSRAPDIRPGGRAAPPASGAPPPAARARSAVKPETKPPDSAPAERSCAAQDKPVPDASRAAAVSAAVETQDPELPGHNTVTFELLRRFWPHIVDAVRKQKITLGLYLSEGRPVGVRKNLAQIGFLKSHEFHRENLEQPQNLMIIEAAAQKIIGAKVRFSFIQCDEFAEAVLAGPAEAGEDTLPGSGEEPQDAEDMNEFIQSIVDVFNGRIVPGEE